MSHKNLNNGDFVREAVKFPHQCIMAKIKATGGVNWKFQVAWGIGSEQVELKFQESTASLYSK